jgi:YidC/Oxa1 family membrane protein insertase
MFKFLATLLSWFFQLTHSYGFAIVLLTITVRLILFPLTAKQTRSMAAMSRVQPQVKKLQAEYKDDRQKLNEELGINPAAGCLPLVLQIPVFIGLFRVIGGLSRSSNLAWLQVNVPKPKYLSESSEMYRSIVKSGGQLLSWGIDLAQSASGVGGTFLHRLPYVGLVVAYAASGWVQQAMSTKRTPQAATGQAAQMQQIMKIFPIFMGIFSYNMPAGLVVYWFASNLWTIGQQELLFRTMPSVTPMDDEPIVVKSAKDAVSQAAPVKKGFRDAIKEAAADSAASKGAKSAGKAVEAANKAAERALDGPVDKTVDKAAKGSGAGNAARPTVRTPGPSRPAKKKGR